MKTDHPDQPSTSLDAAAPPAEVVRQVDTLNEMGWDIRKSDRERALELAGESRSLAETCSYEQGVAQSLLISSFCLRHGGNYEKSFEESSRAVALFDRLEDKRGTARALNGLGASYLHLGEYAKAIDSQSKSIQAFKDVGDEWEMSQPVQSLGGCYFYLGDYAKALEYFQQSLRIKTEANIPDGAGGVLCNIGVVYQHLGQYDKAAEYFLKAMQRSQEIRDTEGESACLSNLGETHTLMGNYADALEYLLRAVESSQRHANKYPEGAAHINLGRLYQATGDREKALDSYQAGLRIVQETSNRQLECEAFIALGEFYSAQKEYGLAVQALREGLRIAEDIENNEHTYKAHSALSNVYELQGEFEKALTHHKAFYTFRQKVFGEVADRNLKRVMIEAEVEKTHKEAEIHRLRHVELAARVGELEERTEELKREQEKVMTLERQVLEQQMAGGFAHEMRNALSGSKLVMDQALGLDGPAPHVSLTLTNCKSLREIHSMVSGVMGKERMTPVVAEMQTIFANEERLGEMLLLVRKATVRGLNITQQIMDYSKFGQQVRGAERIELNSIVGGVVEECRKEFHAQGITFRYSPAMEELSLLGDETHFYSIVENIVLNARDALVDRFVPDGVERCIDISTASENESYSLVISDNGVGIPAENVARIFEPFFSTKPATGTGLGLGMVRKTVLLYGGRIEVKSIPGEGTTFTICLPACVDGAAHVVISEAAEISDGMVC